MAKSKDSNTLKVIVLADVLVHGDKTYKTGDKLTINLDDPVTEGLLAAGSLMDIKEYDEKIAQQKEAEENQRKQDEAAEAEKGGKGGSR